MKKIKPFIHPATPTKLKSAYRKAKGRNGKGYNQRQLARDRRVNPRWVNDLITKGKEPTDQTEQGREIREKLFLPKKRKARAGEKPARQYSEPPEYIKWWRSLKKDERHIAILLLYQRDGGNLGDT